MDWIRIGCAPGVEVCGRSLGGFAYARQLVKSGICPGGFIMHGGGGSAGDSFVFRMVNRGAWKKNSMGYCFIQEVFGTGMLFGIFNRGYGYLFD
jgi:hypothetical protein